MAMVVLPNVMFLCGRKKAGFESRASNLCTYLLLMILVQTAPTEKVGRLEKLLRRDSAVSRASLNGWNT